MKLFGFEITRKKLKSIDDQITVRSVNPSPSIPISKIPSLKPVVLNYGQTFARGRGHFTAGEYDLSEISKISDTDSYVRQAFKKKIGLMFKEGWGWSGPNKNTQRYIKTRMAQIAQATDIPTSELLKRIGAKLVETSNAFLVKVRNPRASGGKSRTTANNKKLQPIAGYFPAAPETMRFDMDEDTGKIIRWKQMLPDGRFKEFLPQDVVHFHIDRREGFTFGIPTLVPVIDDIRALRQIEENIELLLYQNLFPLFHYKVGTETAPAGYTEEGKKEIDVVENEMRMMPSEGVIVTPERHEINAIGAEGRAIRAEGYLEHFKRRVLAGLGVSEVDVGIADTSNRGTARILSRQLVDSVKDIQDALEAQFDHLVIKELLLESTFGDRVLEDENMVHLSFKEIDIENKMEQEEHQLKMFEGNAITWDELRAELGREPIPVPESGDDQDPSKNPEWFNTNWKLFKEPENLIRAVDEPFSSASQAAATARSLGLTGADLQTAQQGREQEQRRAAEEDRATRLAIARNRQPASSSSSRVVRRDNLIETSFSDLESDTANRLLSNLRSRGIIDQEILLSMGRVWAADITDKLHSIAMSELIRGFNSQVGSISEDIEFYINFGRNILRDRISFFINKLVDNTIRLINRKVEKLSESVNIVNGSKEVLQQVHLSFDATRFRTRFIWDVELRKAHNFGRVLALRYLGHIGFVLQAANNACDKCKILDGMTIFTSEATIDDVPPFHPNSRMTIEVIKDISNLKDEAKENEQIEDKTKLESCVLQVKAQLRKKNPSMSEDSIKSRAFAICNAQLKKG